MDPFGNVFIRDVGTGKILNVRASHYPASVAVEVDSLDYSVGIVFSNGVPLYAKIVLSGETIADPSKLN